MTPRALARRDAARHMLAAGERLQTIRLSTRMGVRTISRVPGRPSQREVRT